MAANGRERASDVLAALNETPGHPKPTEGGDAEFQRIHGSFHHDCVAVWKCKTDPSTTSDNGPVLNYLTEGVREATERTT